MAEKNLSHAAVERVIKSIEFRNFLSSNTASLLSGDACHCRVCLAISYDNTLRHDILAREKYDFSAEKMRR